MAGLIMICTRYLRDYEPDRADIIRSYGWWSRCPACRALVDLPRLPDSNEIDYGQPEPKGSDEAA